MTTFSAETRVRNLRSPLKAWLVICRGDIDGVDCRITHHAKGDKLSVSFREHPQDPWTNYVISTADLIASLRDRFYADVAALRVPFDDEEVSVAVAPPCLDEIEVTETPSPARRA